MTVIQVVTSTILLGVVIGNQLVDDNHFLIRAKKQTTYYLCGVYPNQFYSQLPCNEQKCSNGGTYLNARCTVSAQCVKFHNGVSTCINGCCCTVPTSTTTPGPDLARFGLCPSGQLSEVRCNGRGQCDSGQTCMGGLCCTNTGQEWDVACGGLAALGSCSASGTCSSGVCTASNYCCECSLGRSAGRCNNGVCPSGHSCNNLGFCCPSCTNNVMPYGSCLSGRCGGGRTCKAGNICCF